jgi:predicted transcriptional regulator
LASTLALARGTRVRCGLFGPKCSIDYLETRKDIDSHRVAYYGCRHATNLPLGQKYSYTTGMKTAVSIPEDVFKGAERLARKTKRSRSRLFSDALKEYLARHTPDSVTEAMNKACSELGAAKDEFVSSAARRVLERSEW